MAKRYKKAIRNKLTPEQKAAQAAAAKEIIAYFAETYDTTETTRLPNYQKLCKDLKVEVGTNSLACKFNIKNSHTNIYDFVRVRRANGDASTIRFPSEEALREDMRRDWTRRFPLDLAEEDYLIEAMLIFVDNKED